MQRRKGLSAFQIIIVWFAAVILMGALLLMLPAASSENQATSFPDALFTATSAVCVTGLVVFDTATYWSGFGHFIIFLLIQIGGLGVITVGASIIALSRRKTSLMQRTAMQEAVAAPKMGGIVGFNIFIVKVVLAVEAVGTIALAVVFCRDFGMRKGIFMAAFHSISAFCNAGFDLMGEETPYSSLSVYADDPIVNITVMTLIIAGGIGFLTWDDIKNNRLDIRRYSMQTKSILCTTGILILLPAIYFFFCEFGETDFGGRFWCSLFQAVTPRTAGFNTVELSLVSQAGQIIIIVLMLIGGAPGSTAGGMKITNIAVLFSVAVSVLRRENDAHLFGRRIPEQTVKIAVTVFLMYITMFSGAGIIISRIENLPVLSCMFESASAIGTVGLSLGITAQLGYISRAILILLMFAGRVGGLTLVFAAITKTQSNVVKFPQGKITVG